MTTTTDRLLVFLVRAMHTNSCIHATTASIVAGMIEEDNARELATDTLAQLLDEGRKEEQEFKKFVLHIQ